MRDFAAARHNMVECQVRPNKVTDERLLAAMSELPRERFLPKPRQGVAYVDEDIPLGDGRYLMEPMVLARLIQAAAVAPGDLALDVGCGSGYSTAVLARLCDTVVALESHAGLAAEATAALAELGIDNAAVFERPLAKGYAKQAPYDVILFGGAIAQLPEAIVNQLGEGGRLVAVVAERQGMGKGTLFVRRSGVVSSRVLFDAATPLLPEFAPESRFVF